MNKQKKEQKDKIKKMVENWEKTKKEFYEEEKLNARDHFPDGKREKIQKEIQMRQAKHLQNMHSVNEQINYKVNYQLKRRKRKDKLSVQVKEQ